MRLAILALSAAAISGCSWLGGGSHHAQYNTGCYPAGGGHGYQQVGYGYAQGGGCAGGTYGLQQAGAGYGAVYGGGYAADAYGYQYGAGAQAQAQSYGAGGYGNSYAGAAASASAYGGTQGYGTQGYGTQGYGVQTAGASAGAYASSGYGGAATTLGGSAPYGAGLSTQYTGGSYAGGQYGGGYGGGLGGTSSVQTVVGAPIYVGQPYPVPMPRGSVCCGGGGGGYVAGGGAMPFGIELFGGTEFEGSGDLFTKKSVGPPDGDFSIGTRVGSINPISYADAFESAKTIGVAMSYDLSPQTTILGSVSHSEAKGKTVENYTTVQPGTWGAGGFTPAPGSSPRGLDGTFTDLKTTALEAGVRQYVGAPRGLRPYVGATAGFVHNENVQFAQTYNGDGSYYGEREFIASGWNPTASATLGAEVAISPRAAIGVESGIRWRDNMKSSAPSEDRLTIPLTLRGRLSF